MTAIGACLALLARDLTAVRRSRSQLYSSMVTPLFLLVLLGVGVSRGLEPSTLAAGNFTAYLVAGIVVTTAVFSSTFSGASYYRDRDTGMLRMILASPLSPRVLLTGKSLAAVVIGTAQALLVLAIATPFVDLAWQYGIGAGIGIAIVVVILMNLLLAGAAQSMATRVSTMQGFHLLMNLVLFPLLFVSGAFFPIDSLPLWLKLVAWANPLTYGVDALQVAMYAEDTDGFIGLPIDFAVLGSVAVLVYVLGLVKLPRLTFSGR